ncbi:efflux RND transporter periplasmic adaptor subunit [Microbulbifer bruguierae]|uniref:Efflux RND transporter periplasmic adaptor subunit n=1 Tax=Microbulbifer bruguierae TaxID=3029061 RepID=A0ABY8NFN0_9GAMM|nr:efflux RND transporter periplasmic adaptor subunit [Microbulbifer bruguierae]WGL17738.1 efflux RND transporter periplasmic adaptor subunit [Microbulbifer bruguierae]
MARFPIFLMLSLAIFGCAKKMEPPAPKAPPVEVLAVRTHQVVPRYEYVGRVEATDEFKVRPRVEGYIESRNFIEGQMVQQGELLYQIDPKPYIAALDNQRANLAQARSALQIAKRNFQRGRQLVETGAISKVQMDELTGTFEEAESRVAATQADVEAAQLNLSYTEIRAPLTGLIGRSEFTEGSLVGPSTEPLTSIVRMDPIYVSFDVPENRLFAVQSEAELRRQAGQTPVTRDVRIKQPNGVYYPYPGLIVFVDNQIDQTTGSAKVRARFPNPERLLVQGQFARVSISVFEGSDAIKPLVPQASVLEDIQGRFVYVVDDNNIAHKRYLELGQREGDLWAVEKGLKAGERVIVNGLQRVANDKLVAPQNTALNPYKGLKQETPPQQKSPVPQFREGEISPEERRAAGAQEETNIKQLESEMRRSAREGVSGEGELSKEPKSDQEPDAYFDSK